MESPRDFPAFSCNMRATSRSNKESIYQGRDWNLSLSAFEKFSLSFGEVKAPSDSSMEHKSLINYGFITGKSFLNTT